MLSGQIIISGSNSHAFNTYIDYDIIHFCQGEYNDPYIPPTPRDTRNSPSAHTPVIKHRSGSNIKTSQSLPSASIGSDSIKLKLDFNEREIIYKIKLYRITMEYGDTVINKSLRPPCFFRINRKRTIFSVHTFHLFDSFSISITSLIQQS